MDNSPYHDSDRDSESDSIVTFMAAVIEAEIHHVHGLGVNMLAYYIVLCVSSKAGLMSSRSTTYKKNNSVNNAKTDQTASFAAAMLHL
jgi:hypothetical protein